MRLAIIASHPVQYQAPLFRALAQRCNLHVLFAHRATKADQAAAGFNVGFDWDVDLTGGFAHTFLTNVARQPGLEEFGGCDTPEIGAALRGLAPDVALLMGWHLKCYWQAIWTCRRTGIPIMVRGDSQLATPRGLVKRASKALVYPIALRVFDAALYVGEQSRRYWAHYGYPAHRMFFSPHCVDNDWFVARATNKARNALRTTHGISLNAKVAIFAGKLVSFKRPLDLVSAASILRREGQELSVLVAGAGPLEAQMTEMAAANGVPLVKLGFCNQSMMPSVFAAGDVLVLPSSGNETWGLVANEALACGRPVIVSDACGCAPDLASDGTAGTVFQCGNVGELAAAMRQLIAQPPSYDAISARARRYSVTAAADGVLEAACASQPAAHRKAGHG